MSFIQPKKASKVAGLTYILIILLGVLKVNFIESSVIMSGSDTPANNILDNEQLFRIGIAGEILMYLLVVALSLSLYIILKPVNKDLALSALFLRIGEAIIGVMVTIISGLIPLMILKSGTVFDTLQMGAFVELLLGMRIEGLNIVLIFIGLGGTIFCYLFYKSLFVPRILASWGIFTYTSMFILGFLNILLPDRPDIIETVLFSLGGLFEVIFGFWLLLKGINTEKWENLSIKSQKIQRG